MRYSYESIKQTFYLFFALFGLLVILTGCWMLYMTGVSADPAAYFIPGTILLFVGSGCVFFSIETYMLREEQDIWR